MTSAEKTAPFFANLDVALRKIPGWRERVKYLETQVGVWTDYHAQLFAWTNRPAGSEVPHPFNDELNSFNIEYVVARLRKMIAEEKEL